MIVSVVSLSLSLSLSQKQQRRQCLGKFLSISVTIENSVLTLINNPFSVFPFFSFSHQKKKRSSASQVSLQQFLYKESLKTQTIDKKEMKSMEMAKVAPAMPVAQVEAVTTTQDRFGPAYVFSRRFVFYFICPFHPINTSLMYNLHLFLLCVMQV